MKLLLTFILICSLGSTFAEETGGWSGGGGELLKSSNNPWFIHNTKQVNFCIKKSDSFSVSEDRSKELIIRAIQVWKNELSQSEKNSEKIPSLGHLRVGTQSFYYKDCEDDSVDIIFQLGSLDQKQKKYLGSYRKYVGTAIMTSYNEVKLKGKGFVFIAADTGKDKYEGVSESAFWSLDEEKRLFQVLLHELGHVFGIPHTDSIGKKSFLGHRHELMDSIAPEKIANGSLIPNLSLERSQRLFIVSSSDYPKAKCALTKKQVSNFLKMFFIPTNYKCVLLRKNGKGYDVLVGNPKSKIDIKAFEYHGEVLLKGKPIRERYQPLVKLRISSLKL